MDPLNKTIRRTLLKLGSAAFLTDGELLARFVASREQAAFEELMRRHGPMVLRVCQRVLQHVQDAEDAFQATFMVLTRKAGSVAKQESVASWLYGVAYRVALEARSLTAKRRAHETQRPESVLEEKLPASIAAEPTCQDLRRMLDDELQCLPEKYRSSVVLCYFEGKTPAEAAQQLHCQTEALQKRLERARVMLASRLTRRGVALSASGLAGLLAQETATAAVPTTLATVIVRAAAGGGV